MTKSSDEVSTFIEEIRQGILTSKSTATQINSLKAETEQSGGLPIIRDLGRTWALKSDLTVVLLQTEPRDSFSDNTPKAITSEAMRCFVIAIAAKKYPELKAANVERPEETYNCPFCTLHTNQNEKSICKVCEGLGWVPREWNTES